LPKIQSPTATQIAQSANPSPAAQAVLTPQQTPSQYLGALQEKQLGNDMVNTLSHGMSDQDGVNWAAKSAEKVADKLPPQEVEAMKAAKAYAASPTPETKAAAAAAAAQGGCRGPGSMAAQGAAWARPGASAASAAPATPAAAGAAAMPRLTPHAVSGAVLMASAIQANPAAALPALAAQTVKTPAAPALQAPQMAAPAAPAAPAVVPPAVQAEMFKQQHPFIAMGLDIASGKPV
jgi:hypothetical protein